METLAHPLISIIVAVYNSEKYISRCIESILVQTYRHYEIICVDDGSTDSSGQILDQYCECYPDIIRVCHQKNGGAAAARNNGICLAKGDYIAFVDNDDWLDSDWLEVLSGHIEQNSPADVVCSGYRRPDDRGHIIWDCHLVENGKWSPYIVGASWAKLYRAEFIRRNDLTFFDTNIGEDIPFVVLAVYLANSCVVVNYVGYNWFFNTASVSNTTQRKSQGLQLEKTLNCLLARLKRASKSLDPIMTRYFIRYIAWYLFYTRKGDGPCCSLRNLRYYKRWLTTNIPGWEKCSLASPFALPDDTRRGRVETWLLARHPGLFKLMLFLGAMCPKN